MLQTIRIGEHALAQGTFLRSLGDGRIEIDTGHARLSGRPVSDRHTPPAPSTAIHRAFRKALAGGHPPLALPPAGVSST